MCKTAYEMVLEAAEKLKTMPKDEFIDLLERSGVTMREPKPRTKPVPSPDITTVHIRYDVNPCTCNLLANNDYANAKIQLSNNNKKQVITSSVIHPNGVFFYSNQEADFWLLLSKSIGWGRFTKVSKEKEFANIFELAEVRSAEKEPPSVINHSSVVLRRLPEALEVLLSIPSSQLQEYLKTR